MNDDNRALRNQIEALRMQTEIWKGLATVAAERSLPGNHAGGMRGTIPDLPGAKAAAPVMHEAPVPTNPLPVVADVDADSP